MFDKLTTAAKVLTPYINCNPDYLAGVLVGAITLNVYIKIKDKNTVKLTERDVNRLRNGLMVAVSTKQGMLYIERSV